MSLMDNFKELEAKQKAMLVAIIVLVGVAVYMGYSTFFPATPSQEKAASAMPPTFSPGNMPKMPAQTASQTPGSAQPMAVQQPVVEQSAPKAAAPTPEQLALLEQSQQLQQEYVHLVNQYQLAQLKQKLAATNAQIAQANLTATKTEIEAQKLEGTHPIRPAGNGANKLANVLQVKYVGYNQGAWTAMVGYDSNYGDGDGQYYQVQVGTRLPDGSVVETINNEGVVLTKDGQQIYLAIPKTLD